MKLHRLQDALAVVVLVLVTTILAGTAWGLLGHGRIKSRAIKTEAVSGAPAQTQKQAPVETGAPPATAPAEGAQTGEEPQGQVLPPVGKSWYEGIGRLRVAAKDGSAVVLSATFAYEPSDGPFSEELLNRKSELRSIVTGFLAEKNAAELRRLGEEGLKAELLVRFNRTLLLGKVESVYFRDYLVIPR